MPTQEIEPVIVQQLQPAETDREMAALLLPLIQRLPSFSAKTEPMTKRLLKACLLHELAVAELSEESTAYWLEAVRDYAERLGRNS